MIYIASPYTSPDPLIREARFFAARSYANTLMGMGYAAFSPIAYGHQFTEAFGAPANFEPWTAFNDRILLASDQLHILTLPCWEESRGIAYEVDLAERHGIPISHVYWEYAL